VAKRSDPDGKIDTIVELLAETNECLEDMTFLEGNLPTGHRTTIRSGLPGSTWRKLNYGVQPSKSTTVQVTDTAGMLEAYAEVDKALADLNGNTGSFRLSEDRAFLESMNQTMATTLFYGDTGTDPEKFMGLAPRYSSTSAESGDNIISAGGSGSDNTSIWLVVWGPNTCHGIYPKGSSAGLNHQDLGEVTLEDAAGGKYQGYRTHYKWDIGVSVRDWRYVVRIPNIDISNLTKDASGSSANLIDLMVQALEKVPNLGLGRATFYGNRTISSFLRRQITNANNVNISMDEVAGKRVMTFDGIPFRRNDALLNTEAAVS
jgi:hypothetical protein